MYSGTIQKFLPDATENGLSEIVNANITQVLAASNAQFEQLENRIQHEIDRETHCEIKNCNKKKTEFTAAQNMLKQIGDDLFLVAETISTQLRKVTFETLYSSVSYISDPKKTPTMKFIQYRY